MLEFIHKLKLKSKSAFEGDAASEEPNHTQRAELLWIQATQVKVLRDPRFEGTVWSLLDENGIWRCG